MEQQTSIGAILGCTVCTVLAWGNPPLVVLLSAITGFSFGSIAGFLVWLTSLKLPDERVVAPFPGDERRRACPRLTGRPDARGRTCPGFQPFAARRELRVVGPRRPDTGPGVDGRGASKVAVRDGQGWLSRWWKRDGQSSQQLHLLHQSHLWRLLNAGLGVRSALRQRSFPARRKHVYR